MIGLNSDAGGQADSFILDFEKVFDTPPHWLLTYCLQKVYERDGINYFWSIKNSNDVLNKFKSKNFQASKLSTYDFTTLYTTLPHHLIKDKHIDLINRTFIRENTQYLACNEECAF